MRYDEVNGSWAGHDWEHDERESWRREGWRGDDVPDDEPRVTYVVLLDGEVLEHWSERVRDSPWRDDSRAARLQRRRLGYVHDGPQRSVHEQTIRWLESAVGGVTALADLDIGPLPDEDLQLAATPELTSTALDHVLATAAILDRIADRFFDSEVRTAMRRALAACAQRLVMGTRAGTPEQSAAALIWAVAKGNGLVGSGRRSSLKEIAADLGLPSITSDKGKEMARMLRGSDPPYASTAWRLSQLEPLGRAELLTGDTRRLLLTARDEALVAEGRHVEKELAREQARALGREQARAMAQEMFRRRDRLAARETKAEPVFVRPFADQFESDELDETGGQ